MNTKQVDLESKPNLPRRAVTRLYGELKEIVGDRAIDRESVVGIALALMQLVESYEDVKGKQKKELILHVMSLLVSDTVSDKQEAEIVKGVIRLTLPVVIDTIVSVDKKELRVKLRKGFRSLLACCGCD